MNTSTEELVVEQQQNQETNEETRQEAVPENNENSQSDVPKHNQENDFETFKSKLEVLSISFALAGVISTGLVKVMSLGRFIHFSFDINNCEFKLTNTDFIILFLSMFCYGTALLYCYITNGWRIKINDGIIKCFETQTKKLKKLLKIGFYLFLYLLLISVYFILGCVIIYFAINKFNALASLKNELLTILATTFSFEILLSSFTVKENKKLTIIYVVLITILLLLFCFSFTKINYDNAVNQREFEIITLTDTSEEQTYAVISRGSSYSAYQCDIDKENNTLIINVDIHRFFPLDDTETRLYNFEECRFVEFK